VSTSSTPTSSTFVPVPSSDTSSPSDTTAKLRWWNRLAALIVVITSVPAAVLVIPNTMSYVVAQALSDLGLQGTQAAGLVRATGLALPALLLAVPVAAVLARRFPASVVLMAGLAAVLAGELVAEITDTVILVGVVRVIEGLGAGTVLPASLAVAWRHDGPRRERPRQEGPRHDGPPQDRPGRGGRALAAVWAGALVASLIAAMPLALYGMPAGRAPGADPPGLVPGGQVTTDWRAALQPYPALVAVALAAAALCGLLRSPALPVLRHPERTQLLLPFAPAAGFAFLAVVTTYGWPVGAQLLVAGIGLAGLTGLAIVGSRDATAGTPLGFAVVVVTTGLLGMPVAAPLAGLISTHLGPQGVPMTPFAAGAAAALIGGLVASRLRDTATRTAVLVGHGLAVVAVLVLLATNTTSGALPVTAPLVLLGAGLAIALAASLRAAGVGSALFGLTLCFPAVLCGYLVIGPLQVHEVGTVVAVGGGTAHLVYALITAFRIWLIVAGVLAVLLAGAVRLAGRKNSTEDG
jgi:MFS family permease